MERQFNRHHDTTHTNYKPGDSALAKGYRSGVEKWTSSYIKHRIGNVIYEVDVQSTTWVHHANQLRLGHDAPPTSDNSIPLDILLDNLELPPIHVPLVQTDNPLVEFICTPRGWSSRNPKPFTLMQVIPHLKTYTQFEGGGVRTVRS
ncbi:hypothetical protein CRM22_010049 [Opisthorchis felineus]|uniref:Uncharacterized protein n=1 Tax=Opisthorchis felineus TaxID=147828 RepID=A0A4S2L8R0_OPIFE|nr:hypothetical protein CRM22_010049 [Opisthorchis felineus]